MQAGMLRHRLRIQQNAPTKNELGELVDNWGDFATVWAAIEPITGNERWIQSLSVEIAELNTRIRIRYRDGIHTAMRALWRDSVYDVNAVINRWTRDREIWLLCNERAGVLPEGGDNGETC